MQRKPLLQDLELYSDRHPGERETVHRFIEFVNGQADCFERGNQLGHITGSAWVVDRECRKVLLTHHRKLDRWLQLGGHADGDSDIRRVALTEAQEESGIDDFETVMPGIFDIDIHPIPARGSEPEHFHYDVRFLLRPLHTLEFKISAESLDLRWIAIEEVSLFTTEESMLRMVAKHQAVFGQ